MAMNFAPLCPVFPKEYIYANPRAKWAVWVDDESLQYSPMGQYNAKHSPP